MVKDQRDILFKMRCTARFDHVSACIEVTCTSRAVLQRTNTGISVPKYRINATSSSNSNCHFSDCRVNGINFERTGCVPEFTVSALRSVLFWIKPRDGDATTLLALIANFATLHAASTPYKYPIAFSHNRRDAIQCAGVSSTSYRLDLAGDNCSVTVRVIVSLRYTSGYINCITA